jgi:hypothetical protein
MNRSFYSNALNLEIAKAASECKTGQELLTQAQELSKKYGRKSTGILTKIYTVRKKAGINTPRKKRSDANPYMSVVESAKIETKVEHRVKMDFTNFNPSRVEICNDHIKLYF